MEASEPTNPSKPAKHRQALLAVIACLAIFELAVARNPMVRNKVLTGNVSQVEHRLIAPAPPPRVLLFGNSRMLYGVEERQLADQAGVPPAKVLKVTMNGTSVSEYLYLYRHNRSKLSRARYVIIGIDDWDVVSHSLEPVDLRYSGLRERLATNDWRYIPLGLVTWGCHSTYMLRAVLVYLTDDLRAWLRHNILGRPDFPNSHTPTSKGIVHVDPGNTHPSAGDEQEAQWLRLADTGLPVAATAWSLHLLLLGDHCSAGH